MSGVSSRLDIIHPLLRVQFEDLCSSIGTHCASMLASVLEGCVYMTEKIRTESDAKSQSLVKLYYSNILNDVHFSYIKQIDLMADYFKDITQFDKSLLDRCNQDNSKIIHGLIWQQTSTKDKTASERSDRGSKLEKKLDLAQEISLSKSDQCVQSTSSFIEKYQHYLEERANASTPLIMRSSDCSDKDDLADRSRQQSTRHRLALTRQAIGSHPGRQMQAFDLFKKSPAAGCDQRLTA